MSEGTDMVGDEKIQQEIRADFIKRFKKEQIDGVVLEDYLKLINTENSKVDNIELIRVVSNAEIKNDVFQNWERQIPWTR